MSLRATAWAWTQKAPTHGAKLVLLALADHADEIGLCWPSLERVASMTGLSVRAVRMALRDLEASVMITTDQNRGRGNTSRYALCINGAAVNPAKPSGFTPEKEEAVAGFDPEENRQMATENRQSTTQNRQSTTENRKQLPPEPSEPSGTIKEPSVRARGARLDADWWPTPSDQTFARDLGLDPMITADSFRDYWTARTGAGASKLDWSATWRNWCRRDAERRTKPRHQQPASKLGWMFENEGTA
jgi:hypothetical protein